MKEQPMSDEKPMGQVIQIDEARIRDHLGEMVRGTVEETLNAMLDAEADQLCGAGRYERSQARQDTRAGSYDRTLQTSAGEVNLKIPKLRRQTFETAIIERYRRRESSVEEALIEMYLAGISVRRVVSTGIEVSPNVGVQFSLVDGFGDRPVINRLDDLRCSFLVGARGASAPPAGSQWLSRGGVRGRDRRADEADSSSLRFG